MTDGVAQLGLVLDCGDPERLVKLWAPAPAGVNPWRPRQLRRFVTRGCAKPEVPRATPAPGSAPGINGQLRGWWT